MPTKHHDLKISPKYYGDIESKDYVIIQIEIILINN